ncbi:MAG: hypothetical protein A2408_03115 [Candidatus Yonathbacteria bacterium RIFOXYC1_FULL_52_10]|uniref:Uncharacterized protein n=1 Tax=Candidatus Yonathbacteria bacterium RIFOXYD1_FULL_52_36 TaxID=1802730 RepID=A0A1G2SIU3_9BACT|nr:MAG: hypothetical protein A2408_03115 [Candidatus Yonathbacteria bacterium RIFOXYC1_FULL_52_10]OHA84926.1 MAG: hypothetical protein A2591_01200 [Candidatus Yonathbacteria bacterium RIFOXYD1_FULL_52_36]
MHIEKRKIVVGAALIVLVLAMVVFFVGRSPGGLSSDQEVLLQNEVSALVEQGQIDSCDQIKDTMYRTVCRNNIALNKAQETLDVSNCALLDDVLVPRVDCERSVVNAKALRDESVSVCDEMVVEEEKTACKDNFYLSLALKKNDQTLCDQAPEEKQSSCRDEFSFATVMSGGLATTQCDLFDDQKMEKDCNVLQGSLDSQASLTQEFCSEFATEVFQKHCIAAYYQGMATPIAQ